MKIWDLLVLLPSNFEELNEPSCSLWRGARVRRPGNCRTRPDPVVVKDEWTDPLLVTPDEEWWGHVGHGVETPRRRTKGV